MGETLNLLFRKCDDGTFELEAQEANQGMLSVVPLFLPSTPDS